MCECAARIPPSHFHFQLTQLGVVYVLWKYTKCKWYQRFIYLIRLNVMHCGFAMFLNEAITTNANNFFSFWVSKSIREKEICKLVERMKEWKEKNNNKIIKKRRRSRKKKLRIILGMLEAFFHTLRRFWESFCSKDKISF